jgi:hypothetical protein
MAEKTTKKDGETPPPPAAEKETAVDEGALRLQAMEKMYSDALKENARLNAELEAMKKAPAPAVTEEAVPPAIQDSIAAKRGALLEGARAVLGKDAKLDGKSAAEIHRAVIAARHPDVKLDGLSADFVAGRALGIIDAARTDSTTRSDALRDAHPGPGGGDTRNDAADMDPRDKLNNDLSNAWRVDAKGA